MVKLSGKWDHVGTSIFTLMTQMSVRAGAVNLAQGFPDFDGPEEIKEAAIEAIRSGLNQYAPATGLPELRQLLASRQQRRTGLCFDPETEVTVFSGATEAIFCALQAFFGPGDEIVALAPFYDSYPAAAYAAGAKLIGVPLATPGFTFDEAALRAALTPRTKALIVNTPHNPTGRVFNAAELEAVRRVVLERDLLLITDEVYEELVYGSHRHVSLATLPGLAERTVTISSTSKTFSMTGWKVGYAFAPASLSKAMRAVHQFTVFCSATPLQAGMIAALKLGDSYFETFRAEYTTRRDALLAILTTAGFDCAEPQGSYFMLAEYSRHSDKTDIEFSRWLTEEIKVACIPISVFYDDPAKAAQERRYVRFGFCKGLATLRAAGDNLRSLRR